MPTSLPLPSEHAGFVEKRMWHKVIWKGNPHPSSVEWSGIENKMDLMMDKEFIYYKGFIEVLKSYPLPLCAAWPHLRYGKTSEEEINRWLAENMK